MVRLAHRLKRRLPSFMPLALDEHGNILTKPGVKKRKSVSVEEEKNEMRYSLPGIENRTAAHLPADLKCTKKVTVYEPDDVGENGALVMSLALQDLTISDTEDACAMFKTAICTLAPGLKPIFNMAFDEMGYEDDVVKIPTEAAAKGVEIALNRILNKDEQAVMWALCVLILFKDITTENYENFTQNRLVALCSIVDINTEQVSRPVDVERAEELRLYFGSNTELRRQVVSWVVANSSGTKSINRACDYILGVLAWFEMHSFVMMHEALCLTHSRVLFDIRVRKEVIALERAFRLINSCQHPPLYRFFASTNEQKLLEMIQFPTLIAVAIEIKRKSTPSMKNYVPRNASSALVRSLVKIHDYSAANPIESPTIPALNYLIDSDVVKFYAEKGMELVDDEDAEVENDQPARHTTTTSTLRPLGSMSLMSDGN